MMNEKRMRTEDLSKLVGAIEKIASTPPPQNTSSATYISLITAIHDLTTKLHALRNLETTDELTVYSIKLTEHALHQMHVRISEQLTQNQV